MTAQTTSAKDSTTQFSWPAHGLRGIAAFGVFVGHITGGLRLHIYPDQPDFARFAEHVTNLGTFGVELFFVISGFVICASVARYSATEFFARRLVRIYPLFFFFTALYFAGNLILDIDPEKRSFDLLLRNLTFIDLFGPERPNQGGLSPNAWSISFEIWFYCFMGLAATCLRRQHRIALVITGLGFLMFVWRFPIALYFCIGVFCYWLRKREVRLGRNLRWIELVALLGIVAVATAQHFDYTRPEMMSLTPFVLMILTGIFFYSVTETGSYLGSILSSRALTFMGTISFSFYLVHPYSYYVLRFLLGKIGLYSLPAAVAMPVFYTTMTIVAIATSYVVHIVLERGPYQVIFRSNVYHKPQSTLAP